MKMAIDVTSSGVLPLDASTVSADTSIRVMPSPQGTCTSISNAVGVLRHWKLQWP